MPRAGAKKPQVRSDGVATGANATPGQPNGAPRAVMNAAAASAGTGAPMRYGEATQLSDAASQTPIPPGVTPVAHNAAAAWPGAAAHAQAHGVVPMMAPTQRPFEPVTTGAPLAPGPTEPMAVPNAGDPGQSVQSILSNAAAAMPNSPTLRALAEQAAAQTTSSPIL